MFVHLTSVHHTTRTQRTVSSGLSLLLHSTGQFVLGVCFFLSLETITVGPLCFFSVVHTHHGGFTSFPTTLGIRPTQARYHTRPGQTDLCDNKLRRTDTGLCILVVWCRLVKWNNIKIVYIPDRQMREIFVRKLRLRQAPRKLLKLIGKNLGSMGKLI